MTKRSGWKKALIGRQALVFYLTYTFSGVIVDETRNTIVLSTENGLRHFAKKDCNIYLQSLGLLLEGKYLRGRVEERIKQRKVKKW